MAQDLAQLSEATVHLIHMVSREHELGDGSGIESVQAAESTTLAALISGRVNVRRWT